MPFNTEKFIRAVEARIPIWQNKHRHHMNRNVLNKLWKEIAQLFPDTAEKILRKKWKNFRDQFVKKSRAFDAGTDENATLWPHFQLMMFMKDDLTPKSNEGNLMIKDETTDGNSNDDERSPSPQSSTGSSTGVDEQQPSSKRKCTQDIRLEFLELEKKKLDLQIKQSHSSEGQDCEDLLFFKSLLPYMKDLFPMQKLRARNKITQVIIDEMNSDMA